MWSLLICPATSSTGRSWCGSPSNAVAGPGRSARRSQRRPSSLATAPVAPATPGPRRPRSGRFGHQLHILLRNELLPAGKSPRPSSGVLDQAAADPPDRATDLKCQKSPLDDLDRTPSTHADPERDRPRRHRRSSSGPRLCRPRQAFNGSAEPVSPSTLKRKAPCSRPSLPDEDGIAGASLIPVHGEALDTNWRGVLESQPTLREGVDDHELRGGGLDNGPHTQAPDEERADDVEGSDDAAANPVANSCCSADPE